MWNCIKSRGSHLVSGLLNSAYPSSCPVCKGFSNNYIYSPICSDCWQGIAQYSGPSCRICALPLVSEHSTVCGECIKKRPSYSRALTYGIYAGPMAEAINLMKFFKLKRLSQPLGSLLFNLQMPECDAIVPVPLSKQALRARGFNQSLLLAKMLSEKLKQPLLIDLLLKKKDTPAQVGLSAKERNKNLKGAFEVKEKINKKRLLLVDDVLTTGATAKECSRTLLKAGAKDIIVITLARSSMI